MKDPIWKKDGKAEAADPAAGLGHEAHGVQPCPYLRVIPDFKLDRPLYT